jgi:hypothetical protein
MGASSGPDLIQDGLTFHVDASDNNSYPDTGTTWFDLVGNQNGTLTNSPSFDSSNGGCFDFDGTNDHVVCGNNFSFLDDPDANEFTITAWINGAVGSDGTVFSKADNSNRMVQLYTETDDTAIIKVGGTTITGTTVVADSTWHNVGMVIRNDGGTFKAQLYVDGVADASEAAVGSTTATDRDFLIGARRGSDNSDVGYLFDGKIASVAIWNRALQINQLEQNFKMQKTRFGV